MNNKEIIRRYRFKAYLKRNIAYLNDYIYNDTNKGYYLPDTLKNAIKDKIELLETTLKEYKNME